MIVCDNRGKPGVHAVSCRPCIADSAICIQYVTRYEKRDRSGYFIIFAFLVSIDSYTCVQSNCAN